MARPHPALWRFSYCSLRSWITAEASARPISTRDLPERRIRQDHAGHRLGRRPPEGRRRGRFSTLPLPLGGSRSSVRGDPTARSFPELPRGPASAAEQWDRGDRGGSRFAACPSGSPITNDIVIRDIYILSSNDATKFADWVAYRVTREAIGRSESRNWKSDPWLADNETLEPPDYTGANAALGTDRGHQAPLASF